MTQSALLINVVVTTFLLHVTGCVAPARARDRQRNDPVEFRPVAGSRSGSAAAPAGNADESGSPAAAASGSAPRRRAPPCRAATPDRIPERCRAGLPYRDAPARRTARRSAPPPPAGRDTSRRPDG